MQNSRSTSAAKITLGDGNGNRLAAPINNNNGVLASLPPIVPTIRFSSGMSAAATNDVISNDATVLSAESEHNADGNKCNANGIIPPSIKLGSRLILTSSNPCSWAWRSFTSSARHDGARFHHWVRANVEYADYPYARFDVNLDPLVYTEEEYGMYLEMGGTEELDEYHLVTRERKANTVGSKKTCGRTKPEDPTTVERETINYGTPLLSSIKKQLYQSNKILPWTKVETDALVELARVCDLRWPVIIDRWHSRFGKGIISSLRKVEDLQHRYYTVGSILAQRRTEAVMAREVVKFAGAAPVACIGAGTVTGTTGGSEVGGHVDSSWSAVETSVLSARGPPMGPAVVTVTSSAANTGKSGHLSISATTTAAAECHCAPSSQPQPIQPQLPLTEAEAPRLTHHLTSLHPTPVPPLSLPATGTTYRGAKMFDLAAERGRWSHLHRIWHRSKEEEREEEELRLELRNVEAQLRKLKKSGKHLLPAGSALGATAPRPTATVNTGATTGGMMPLDDTNAHHINTSVRKAGGSVLAVAITKPLASASAYHTARPLLRPSSDPFSHMHYEVSASFADTAPVPTPGTPYLQSGRLFPPSVEGRSGLNRGTLKHMVTILDELRVPREPLATRRSCDLFDRVRKDALTLFILQKMVLRKEAELTAKKGRLEGIQAAVAAAAAKDVEDRSAETGKPATSNAIQREKVGIRPKGKKSGLGGGGKGKRARAESASSFASTDGVRKGGPKKLKKRPAVVATLSTAPPSRLAQSESAIRPAFGALPAASAGMAVTLPLAPDVSSALSCLTGGPTIASGEHQHRQPPMLPASASSIATVLSPPANDADVVSGCSSFAQASHLIKTTGKTTKNKPGRKPRGRKKASTSQT